MVTLRSKVPAVHIPEILSVEPILFPDMDQDGWHVGVVSDDIGLFLIEHSPDLYEMISLASVPVSPDGDDAGAGDQLTADVDSPSLVVGDEFTSAEGEEFTVVEVSPADATVTVVEKANKKGKR